MIKPCKHCKHFISTNDSHDDVCERDYYKTTVNKFTGDTSGGYELKDFSPNKKGKCSDYRPVNPIMKIIRNILTGR